MLQTSSMDSSYTCKYKAWTSSLNESFFKKVDLNTNNKLGRKFRNNNDNKNRHHDSRVYSIECKYKAIYNGQTSRALKLGLKADISNCICLVLFPICERDVRNPQI